jgi:hypothetical protein
MLNFVVEETFQKSHLIDDEEKKSFFLLRRHRQQLIHRQFVFVDKSFEIN